MLSFSLINPKLMSLPPPGQVSAVFMIVLSVGVSLVVVEVPYLTMELITDNKIHFNNTTAHCEMYPPDEVHLL